jgi:hypothetical protein
MVSHVPRRDRAPGGTPLLRLTLAPSFGSLELKRGERARTSVVRLPELCGLRRQLRRIVSFSRFPES